MIGSESRSATLKNRFPPEVMVVVFATPEIPDAPLLAPKETRAHNAVESRVHEFECLYPMTLAWRRRSTS